MHYGFASFLGTKNARHVIGESVWDRNTIGTSMVVRDTLLVARLGTWVTMGKFGSLSNLADILILASPFRIEDSRD